MTQTSSGTIIDSSVSKTLSDGGKLHLFGCPGDWKPSTKTWERLVPICLQMGVKEILAPYPKMEADTRNFATRDDLVETIRVSDGELLVRRGFDSHVVVLQPGEVGWFSTADCPCIIARDPKTGVAVLAHAGRRCLLGEESLRDGWDYVHKSVVDTIMRIFKGDKGILVDVVCGIAGISFPHKLDDPKYGVINARRQTVVTTYWGMGCLPGDLRLGNLCLRSLIKAQLVSAIHGWGLPGKNVRLDSIDTRFDEVSDGIYTWHSSIREWRDGFEPSNGVLFENC